MADRARLHARAVRRFHFEEPGMNRCLLSASLVALLLVCTVPSRAANCTVTTVNRTPINDLGTGFYLGGFQGGLYPGGSNTVPAAHDSTGRNRAAGVQPL